VRRWTTVTPIIAFAAVMITVNGIVGISLLVLAPETLAAVRDARRDRMQTSFKLALGSAMACIGLTIHTLAVASIWLEGPLALGLDAAQIVLPFTFLMLAFSP
jgi:Ca2+:H+ antiporter